MPIVYLATNRITGHRYIGKTRGSLAKRKSEHHADAKRGAGFLFHRAIRRYGEGVFEWAILSRHTVDAEAIAAEIKWIAKLKPEYNLTIGGEGAAGAIRTAETKAKLAAAARLRPSPSEETRRKIGEGNRGKIFTEEQKARVTAGMMGHILSAEARTKIGNANRGRTISQAQIEQVRAANLGRKQSAETIARRVVKLRGQKRSDEFRAAASARMKLMWEDPAFQEAVARAVRPKEQPKLRGQKRSEEFKARQRELALRQSDSWRLRLHLGAQASSKPVVCLDDGIIYPSASAAARAYGVAKSAIIELCGGRRGRKTVKNRRFAYSKTEEQNVISS